MIIAAVAARSTTLGLIVALAAAPVAAQDTQRRLTPAEIQALPGAPSATSGVVSRVLLGDPAKAGPYALALTYPAGLEIKPHRHRDHRNAVIVQGSVAFGYGETADRAQAKTLGPGSYYTEAAETPHFAFVGPEGLTMYLTGWGPSDNRPVVAPAK